MKIIRLIGIIALLSLYPAFCQAERQLWAAHNFSDLKAKGKLEFTGSTIGTTPELTYTCSGKGAAFAYTNADYVISLPNNGSEVVISPAISKLAGIYITYGPSSQCGNVKVYVSTDGTSWGEIPNADIVCTSSTIDVTMNRRNYYIKIVHTTKADFYIRSINYYTEDCNCFPYIPE